MMGALGHLLAVAMLAMVVGCATMTRGTTEAFVVETTPGGAKVATSLGMICEPTPCVIPRIERDSSFTVTITKDGYKPTTHAVTHEFDGGGGMGMAGNVFLGGIIGAAVDANSGATQRLVPNPLRVTLEPLLPEQDAPRVVAEPVATPIYKQNYCLPASTSRTSSGLLCLYNCSDGPRAMTVGEAEQCPRLVD